MISETSTLSKESIAFFVAIKVISNAFFQFFIISSNILNHLSVLPDSISLMTSLCKIARSMLEILIIEEENLSSSIFF